MIEETPFSRPKGPGRYNDDPVPNGLPDGEKPTAKCNHCDFQVYWDQFGEASMEAHFKEKHPDRI
jgi:hypothetical protein